ncbi:MAG TPA: hypothetical protein VJ692_11970 [Nitrospiraceae bacterium]|nr:hypothetical protein [Nitrospiraceae bacterium]
MAKMNVDPMTTFQDGSRLLLSTQYVGEANFKCELYVSAGLGREEADLRLVSGYAFEAATCREAQEQAYVYAMRLYPNLATHIRKPPYLIWSGPTPQMETGRRRQHYSRRGR